MRLVILEVEKVYSLIEEVERKTCELVICKVRSHLH